MRIVEVERKKLRKLLNGNTLRKGHMLMVAWPRRTDKKARDENGNNVVVEAAGTLIWRRLILKKDWEKPTPSGSYVPAGGHMFNVKSAAEAAAIKKKGNFYLFLSLEGKTHPHGETDHPVIVSLDDVFEIRDCHDDILYRIKD